MTGHPRFTTERREVSAEEMGWGTSSERSWREEVADSHQVTVDTAIEAAPIDEVLNTVIDQFEDQDLSEYSVDANGSHKLAQSTERVWDGSSSVEFYQHSSTKVFAAPGDGLNYLPQQGDVIEWYVNHDYIETSDTAVVFGSNGNPSNWTEGFTCSVRADSDNADFIMSLSSRSRTFDAEFAPLEDYLDEWLRGRFEWRSGGTVVYELYHTQGSGDRSQHTLIDRLSADATGAPGNDNRAFGFFANNFGNGGRRSRAFYDNIRASRAVV